MVMGRWSSPVPPGVRWVVEEFGDGEQAGDHAAGEQRRHPQRHAPGAGVGGEDTTAHCTATITAAVPSARTRLPPIRVTSWVCRATR